MNGKEEYHDLIVFYSKFSMFWYIKSVLIGKAKPIPKGANPKIPN